jgi:hypothetical protein
MADPFTIIGTTAAILDFAQFVGKIIYTAYSLYDSESSSTPENARLEDVTLKMNQLLDSLQAGEAAISQSNQEESIAQLVAHCRGMGQRIITLLKKTKPKTTSSLRECIRAAMATVWTKSVVSDLKKELGFCVTQLNLHIQAIMRYCRPLCLRAGLGRDLTMSSQIRNQTET